MELTTGQVQCSGTVSVRQQRNVWQCRLLQIRFVATEVVHLHVVAFGSEEQAYSLLLSRSAIRFTECPRNARTYEPDFNMKYYSQKSGLCIT